MIGLVLEVLETQTPTSKGQTEQKRQRGQRETERDRKEQKSILPLRSVLLRFVLG